MKKLSVLALGLLLVGCGSESVSDTKTHSFKIADKTWSLNIPLSWNMLDVRPNDGEVLIAQNQYKNFILQRSKGYKENMATALLTEAKKDFFAFELLEQKAQSWTFKGKLSVDTSERIFWQKIDTIGNSGEFLIASCSQESFDTEETECKSILNSWTATKGE